MASSRNSFSPLSFAEFLNQQELNNIQHDMLNIRQFAGPAMSSERTASLPMLSRPPAYQPKRSYSDQVKNGQTQETYIPQGLVDRWIIHNVYNDKGRVMFQTGTSCSDQLPNKWQLSWKDQALLSLPIPIKEWDDVAWNSEAVWVKHHIFPNGDMEQSFDQGWTWAQWTPSNINPWHAAYPCTVPLDNRRRSKQAMTSSLKPTHYKLGQKPMKGDFTKANPWNRHTSEHGKLPKKEEAKVLNHLLKIFGDLTLYQAPDSIDINGIKMNRLPKKGKQVLFTGLKPNKHR